MADVPDIRDQIREILLRDWDPSNASRFEHSRGEYDSYLQPLSELLHAGASEEQIMDYLHERELESMCFPGLDTRRLLPVARKLIALGRGLS
ncbi:MAG TPA: hypothetical protein VF669_13000 [Tepidisphaeraceae bacterium]|jgi:hypothetical protein